MPLNGSPGDLLVVALVVLGRLLLPLLIPWFPLPGILAALTLDAIDQTLFQGLTHIPLDGYQAYDKALDVYYQSIAYLSTLRNWEDDFAFRTGRLLFYLRLAGVALFEWLDWRILLFLLPNTFEYFFIWYELLRLRREPRLAATTVVSAAAAIWIVVKLPQEYWLHIARLDLTDVLKTALFGASPATPWGHIFRAAPWLYVGVALLGVGVIVALAWLAARAHPIADRRAPTAERRPTTADQRPPTAPAECASSDAPRSPAPTPAECASSDAPRSPAPTPAECESSDAPRSAAPTPAECESSDAPRSAAPTPAERAASDALHPPAPTPAERAASDALHPPAPPASEDADSSIRPSPLATRHPLPPRAALRAARAAWAERIFDRDMAEKLLLTSLITAIFAQMLPGTRPATPLVVLGAAVVVTLTTVLSHALARRGVGWTNALGQFLVMLAANCTAVFLYRALPGTRNLDAPAVFFFVLLLSVIVTLFDRFQIIQRARQEEGARF